MFDPQALNLITKPTVLDQRDFERDIKILDALIPIIEASVERFQYEWDKRAHIEIGDDTYALKPNESGGYSWERIDYFDNDWYEEDEPEGEISTTRQTTTTTEQWQPRSEQPPNTIPQLGGYIRSTQQVSLTAPNDIDSQHWHELVEGSAIHPGIAELNFKSLHHDPVEQEHEAWAHLMYSPEIARRNDGRLRDADLARYEHIEKGGWWCDAGIDPRSFVNLQPGEQPDKKLWGCYKPNEPRFDKDKPDKKIKYEHPPKTNLSIFLLEVPDEIANKVYNKAGVNPSASDLSSGFWYCVWKHNIPITISEGAKKTAAILSQGDAAIGLPGINAGYRSNDEQGNPIKPHLREEFAVFANAGREVRICFDYETKAKTKKNVRIAIARTGQLLERHGAKVSVVSLPGPEKGIDDLIVERGTEGYQKAVGAALPLEQWQQQNSPTNASCVIFLKDGREVNLYEKQADFAVTSNPAVLEFPQVGNIIQQLQENERGSTKTVEPPNKSANNQASVQQYWAAQQVVPNYAQNLPRKFLLQRENKDIALTAKKLVNQYGVQADDGSVIYRSEAFSIRKCGDTLSIHRATDEIDSYFSFPLMQFEVNKNSQVKILKNPVDLLTVERQQFLNIGRDRELPSFYEDAKTLKHSLGSLAPLGTQKIIKSMEAAEVLQLLTTTLERAGSKHLQVGDYQIKSSSERTSGQTSIKLIKKDKNSLERVAVDIDTTNNLVKIMKLSARDLDNLRLIAKRVQLEYAASQPNLPPKRQNIRAKSGGIEM